MAITQHGYKVVKNPACFLLALDEEVPKGMLLSKAQRATDYRRLNTAPYPAGITNEKQQLFFCKPKPWPPNPTVTHAPLHSLPSPAPPPPPPTPPFPSCMRTGGSRLKIL